MPPPKLVRKKSFDRTVTKKCPKCEDKVPVACRYCPCGHQFSSKKLNHSLPGRNIDSSLGTRRTKRTSRERPDYFNSLVLDNQARQARRKREPSQSSTTSEPPPPPPPQPVSPKKRRGRPKGTPNKDKDGKMKSNKTTNKTPNKEKETEEEAEKEKETPEEDPYSNISAEKTWQLSMILADINRKFTSQTFNPV